MHKLKFKWQFIILLSTVSLITILFFTFKPSIFNSQKTPENNQNTTFKKIDLQRYEEDLDMTRVIYNNPEYWNNWKYETNMIETEILRIDKDYDEFILRISRPSNQSFSKTKYRARINCPVNNNIIVSKYNPNKNLLDGGFDIFEKAEVGDAFYAYCLDENCLNLGKSCMLMK